MRIGFDNPGPIEMPTGVFTVSLDFELIWGTLDKPKWKRFQKICEIERQDVIHRLLALFAEYEIGATWCTVGHLFLARCAECGWGHKGLEPPVPGSADDARMRLDPCSNEDSDPIFYGRELIAKIQQCKTPQEIGSHSFSHRMFDDPLCTPSVAASELSACVSAAAEMGIGMSSFAFPRNRIGHVDLLAEHGFTAYRGQDRSWYEMTDGRRWYHRLGHLLDIAVARTPSPVMPVWNNGGLWEIPGSMLFTPSYGFRQYIPMSLRVSRARKGLEAAARTKQIFHLWFHPTDLVVGMDAMLDGLRQIFEIANELRAAGKIEVLSMAGIVEKIQPADRLNEVRAMAEPGR